jgi:hypothetical protein
MQVNQSKETTVDSKKAVIEDMGKSLQALYSWNSSTDIEALQTLLCISLLADDKGYAQLGDIRREVGIAHDRMTRCTRLLMGYKKSVSIPLMGGSTDRQPLVDMATYDDSPSVKRIALTPIGRDIVNRILMPLVERQQRIDELEAEAKDHEKLVQAVKAIGYDPAKLVSNIDGDVNSIFNARARLFLSALIDDVAALSPQQLYDLGLPEVQRHICSLPGFSPDTESGDAEQARKQMGFNLAIIRNIHKD